jgi:hypothetical protein
VLANTIDMALSEDTETLSTIVGFTDWLRERNEVGSIVLSSRWSPSNDLLSPAYLEVSISASVDRPAGFECVLHIGENEQERDLVQRAVALYLGPVDGYGRPPPA